MGSVVKGIAGGIMSKKAGKRESSSILEGGERAKGILDPFTSGGTTANQSIMDALGQGEDGAQDGAFQKFLNSTGFKSQLKSGVQGITGSAASKGLLNSGSTLKGITEFGQNLAQGGFQNFLSNLGGVASRGLSAGQQSAQIVSGSATDAAGARRSGDENAAEGFGDAFQGALSFF